MAKFVKLNRRQISLVLSEKMADCKEYGIFDESGKIYREFSSIMNNSSIKHIVERYTKANSILFSTQNIKKIVLDAVYHLLDLLIIECTDELEALAKFEAFEYDDDRYIQAEIDIQEYDAKISEEIDELVDKNTTDRSEESKNSFDD